MFSIAPPENVTPDCVAPADSVSIPPEDRVSAETVPLPISTRSPPPLTVVLITEPELIVCVPPASTVAPTALPPAITV
ncbi:hypothetical protein A9R05_41525 (plasmid) [Burkholderia sp. KK1]|nr:hypothetical protein A9R05_41525 [Burkholderia sp. KK1]